MSEYREQKQCRICGGGNLTKYLDLGKVPLANNLVTEDTKHMEKRYPLEVVYCLNCSFSQLSIVVNPDIMFRNYVYRSSVSSFFSSHCREWAQELNSGFLGKDELVIDIASNDGCLLKEFKALGNRVLGVDPAVNLAQIANKQGIETIAEYWTAGTANEIIGKYGKAKAIIAVNVFAHIDDLHSMVEGVKIALKEGGRFMIESPHLLSLIENTEFDTIYHEHLSYLLVGPLEGLMKEHGLRIARVKKYGIHGGSIRLYIESSAGEDTSDGSTQKIMREEEQAGLYDFSSYIGFGKKVSKIRKELTSLLKKAKSGGKTVAAFGASAKGNTLLNYCSLGKEYIEFIVDDTPEKQGKLYPGVHIPILPREALYERKPDYLLLLAWNFAEEIMQKTAEYRKQGGKYIIPIPRVRVVPEA